MSEGKKPDIQALFGAKNLSAIDARIAEIAAHPATSHWLRQALSDAVQGDALDALKDAETLVELLELRYNAVILKYGHIQFDDPD